MREIKFRGKRIDNDEWVYGYLISNDVIVGEIVEFSDEYFNTEFWYKVDPETVGQYTGLKDKNGKEIYEGDFFKDVADEYLWQVFYDEGCYYASSGPDTLMLQEFLMESGKCDVEVVGNIYENPELAKT